MQQPLLSSFASQLNTRDWPFGADHTISRRTPDPSSRPSDPFLHLEGRESTLDPRNRKTARVSTLHPRVARCNALAVIPLPKNLSRKISRFFVSKISPATGVIKFVIFRGFLIIELQIKSIKSLNRIENRLRFFSDSYFFRSVAESRQEFFPVRLCVESRFVNMSVTHILSVSFVCVCVCVCVLVCVCVCLCVCGGFYLHLCFCVAVWLCVSIQCLCQCLCVCLCFCVCVCVCAV